MITPKPSVSTLPPSGRAESSPNSPAQSMSGAPSTPAPFPPYAWSSNALHTAYTHAASKDSTDRTLQAGGGSSSGPPHPSTSSRSSASPPSSSSPITSTGSQTAPS